MPRIVAVDYGTKRVGVAVTDELQIIASGLTTVHSSEIIQFLKDYCDKEKVECIVIGEPKSFRMEIQIALSPLKTLFGTWLKYFQQSKLIE